MCSVFDFDRTKLVRDGCTRCRINCYRDSSLMQHVAVSVNDACRSFGRGRLIEGFKALARRTTFDSLRAVLEGLPWIARFERHFEVDGRARLV